MTRRVTRRGALALLGTLAGCSGVNPLPSEPEIELDGTALRALVDDSVPTVPERIPVGVGADHLDATESRARTLVDAVPATLGPDEIPNGAIRERVHHRHEHAVEGLSEATNAATPFERLAGFADARTEARFATGAWRAIDDGLDREDFADEAEAIREDRRALRDRWRYVGGDPVDATLVHAAIERRIASGRADIPTDGSRRYYAGNPLGVGELAEEVEQARVAVDDAAHLYDRLTAPLDDPVDLRTRLVDARQRLRDGFESDRNDLPPVDPERPWRIEGVDTDETPAAEALEELYRPIDPRYDDGWGRTTPAEALTWAHASFVSLGAFASLRERVSEGETFAIESVEDVEAMRSAAIEAVREVEETPAEPAWTRISTTQLATQIEATDRRLLETDANARAAWLRNDVSTYLTVMARARATPPASERVAEALRAG